MHTQNRAASFMPRNSTIKALLMAKGRGRLNRDEITYIVAVCGYSLVIHASSVRNGSLPARTMRRAQLYAEAAVGYLATNFRKQVSRRYE